VNKLTTPFNSLTKIASKHMIIFHKDIIYTFVASINMCANTNQGVYGFPYSNYYTPLINKHSFLLKYFREHRYSLMHSSFIPVSCRTTGGSQIDSYVCLLMGQMVFSVIYVVFSCSLLIVQSSGRCTNTIIDIDISFSGSSNDKRVACDNKRAE
jgi:hypothetical protein